MTGPWTPDPTFPVCRLPPDPWKLELLSQAQGFNYSHEGEPPNSNPHSHFQLLPRHLLLGTSQGPQALQPELAHLCPHPSPLWAPPQLSLRADLCCHLPSPELSVPPPPHSLALPQGLCTVPLPQSSPRSNSRSSPWFCTPTHPSQPTSQTQFHTGFHTCLPKTLPHSTHTPHVNSGRAGGPSTQGCAWHSQGSAHLGSEACHCPFIPLAGLTSSVVGFLGSVCSSSSSSSSSSSR